MTPTGITIRRTPYEEPYHLNLRIAASNGRLCGELEYYCNSDDLSKIGAELRCYSGKKGAEFVYELGSEESKDNFLFFLSLRVKAIDLCGHCCVVIRLNNNQLDVDREVIELGIAADTADINRFGELLEEFGQLKHRILVWRVTSGDLLNNEEEAV